MFDAFRFVFFALKVHFPPFLRQKMLLDRKLRNAPNSWTLLPASRSCLYSLNDIVVWIAWSFRHICPQNVAKGSFSEH